MRVPLSALLVCLMHFADDACAHAPTVSKAGAVTKPATVTRLNLSNRSSVNDAELEQHLHLQGLTKLEVLYLNSTSITGSGLEHLQGLTSLEVLSLYGTRVNDADLRHLGGLTSLEVLDLRQTRVTGIGLKHLKGLPRLQTLRLSQVTNDAGMEHVKGLSSLEELKLYHGGRGGA